MISTVDKTRETMQTWYGYVSRRYESEGVKMITQMNVQGRGRRGRSKKPVGRA